MKIQYALSGSQYSISEINESATPLENDYEDMLRGVHRMSICSTIQEDHAYMLQRMQCISIWEARLFARADSVKTREETISVQEEAIHVLENRSDTLLCKICFQNDSDIILVPCLHIAMCATCHVRVFITCPVCMAVVHDSRVVFIT